MSERIIHLLLIDDHALFREGLGRLLAGESDLAIAGTCPDLKCGRTVLGRETIDVLLLDFDLGYEPTIEFVKEARMLQPSMKILVVTAGVSERNAQELVQAGVSGIFHKHNDPQTLSRRIRAVFEGEVVLEEVYLKPLFQMARPKEMPAPLLTEREKAVLEGVLEGLPNKLIAGRVGASESAVKGILQQLFQKTGVRTRSQLVKLALEQRLV